MIQWRPCSSVLGSENRFQKNQRASAPWFEPGAKPLRAHLLVETEALRNPVLSNAIIT